MGLPVATPTGIAGAIPAATLSASSITSTCSVGSRRSHRQTFMGLRKVTRVGVVDASPAVRLAGK
jgi:hypothetical protein